MTEPTPRGVASINNDGHAVSLLTPEQQRAEDNRQAEQAGLKRGKLKNFFRIFRVVTQDRP